MTCEFKVTMEMSMKPAVLLMVTLGIVSPFAGQAATASTDALNACATAIKQFHPEVTGPKQVVKRRSGPQSRYEYWINAGTAEGQSETRIYCRASRREGVIALAARAEHWANGKYPRPDDAAYPSTLIRVASDKQVSDN